MRPLDQFPEREIQKGYPLIGDITGFFAKAIRNFWPKKMTAMSPSDFPASVESLLAPYMEGRDRKSIACTQACDEKGFRTYVVTITNGMGVPTELTIKTSGVEEEEVIEFREKTTDSETVRSPAIEEVDNQPVNIASIVADALNKKSRETGATTTIRIAKKSAIASCTAEHVHTSNANNEKKYFSGVATLVPAMTVTTQIPHHPNPVFLCDTVQFEIDIPSLETRLFFVPGANAVSAAVSETHIQALGSGGRQNIKKPTA